ncbi:MAG: hypothetical protein B7O98_04660 [Zestosphaera tikiterensis]|uniref:Peptidase A2 domain-containing protein n=1 Tax=Zestosphaera tikiterensis TaxID=1973259 RepID=A0A2R7Y5V1_9CREN|nr:MAG: hypothetical protein B7O98_04660 [Zestosphaera tikiterensis]
MAGSVEFKYVERRRRYYPIIPVRLIGSHGKILVYVLVDSGASISLFHTSVAEYAGISFDNAEPAYLAGVGGYVKAYLKKHVNIEIEGIGRVQV